MNSHTPLPWNFPSKYATHIVDCNHRIIVDVPQPNWMSDEEHKANKSLVHAAPDLLEALEFILASKVASISVTDRAEAERAIAKAKGGAA